MELVSTKTGEPIEGVSQGDPGRLLSAWRSGFSGLSRAMVLRGLGYRTIYVDPRPGSDDQGTDQRHGQFGRRRQCDLRHRQETEGRLSSGAFAWRVNAGSGAGR